jgi:hypothetical protein
MSAAEHLQSQGTAKALIDPFRVHGSGRVSGVEQCLEFDGGEPAESVLSSTVVVGALDPRHDRQPELGAAAPAAPVEHVLLQQAEELLHGGVVRAGPGPSHRPTQLCFAKNTLVGV